jgi:hypothetical protein
MLLLGKHVGTEIWREYGNHAGSFGVRKQPGGVSAATCEMIAIFVVRRQIGFCARIYLYGGPFAAALGGKDAVWLEG